MLTLFVNPLFFVVGAGRKLYHGLRWATFRIPERQASTDRPGTMTIIEGG